MGPDPKVDSLQRGGDPVLLALEQVQWDRTRIMSLEELGLLPLQFGAARGKLGQFCRTLTHHLVELGMQHARERLPGLGRNLDARVEAFDQALHVLDQHRLPGTVTPSSMAGRAHEVGVDGALTGLGVADDETGTALPTEGTALEVMVVDLGGISGGRVGAQHDLDLFPHFDRDDGIMGTPVGDTLIDDDALVVRVRQHPVDRGLGDRLGRATRCRQRGQATGDKFPVKLAGRPVPRREDLEGPTHQLRAFLIDFHGTNLASHVIADTDIAVADRSLRDGATLGGLLGQALDDFGGKVAGIELRNRGHDAVQEHARRGLINVLGGRDQSDARILERQVDRDVVSSVAGEAVNLVNDAVAGLVRGDVLDHPHQLGPVGLVGGLARVDELLDDGRTELVGLALVGFTLRRDREPLRVASLFGLLLGGDTQVGHRNRNREWGGGDKAVDGGFVHVVGCHGTSPLLLVP